MGGVSSPCGLMWDCWLQRRGILCNDISAGCARKRPALFAARTSTSACLHPQSSMARAQQPSLNARPDGTAAYFIATTIIILVTIATITCRKRAWVHRQTNTRGRLNARGQAGQLASGHLGTGGPGRSRKGWASDPNTPGAPSEKPAQDAAVQHNTV